MRSFEAKTAVAQPSPRLASLDVFRGATMAAMILVNNPGDWAAVYAPLKHATWHGWTFTDLVFPFFLWIVGVAIPLSIARRLEQGASRRDLFGHAVRRALIIFGLGLFLNSFGTMIDGSLLRDGLSTGLHNYLTTVRIPGVLQRIAVCYLAAVAIYLCTGTRGQLLTIAGLLGGYWMLMMLVPVPGHGAGVLEKQGNLAGYLDNLVLNGPVIGTHVWKSAGTWDPEGLLSTLPAIATCLFGVGVGTLLRSEQTPESKTAWIYTGGAVLLLCGQIMNMWFPINKPIWTSSYAVFMAGMAMLCFGACYWLVDVQGWRKWSRPFAIYGMNAITVYMLAGIFARLLIQIKVGSGKGVALRTWLYTNTFGHLPNPRLGSMLWGLSFVALLYVVAWYMHRRKWFIRF